MERAAWTVYDYWHVGFGVARRTGILIAMVLMLDQHPNPRPDLLVEDRRPIKHNS